MSTLALYDDQELALVLDFIERTSAAETQALAELRSAAAPKRGAGALASAPFVPPD